TVFAYGYTETEVTKDPTRPLNVGTRTTNIPRHQGSLWNLNHTEDEINLLDYWRVIWRGKWIIILLCLVSVSATAWYSFNLPKIYQAKTTIIPTDAGGGGLAAALSAMPFAGALGGALPTTPSDKIIAILESQTIAEKVIRRLDLMPVIFEKDWDPVKKDWKANPEPPTIQKAVQTMRKDIVKVSADKRGTVGVTVEFPDPKRAASIANTYISVLAEYLNDHAINANFQVLDSAMTPEKKFKPSIRLNIMLAGVVSLLVSIFLVFIMEYIRKVRENETRRNGSPNPG
ncbi:MAG: hypothetical protein HZA19_05585, partial [Nitrospirae bacterium]|nr:hypothetical protein [Nitrospirota bacterium]